MISRHAAVLHFNSKNLKMLFVFSSAFETNKQSNWKEMDLKSYFIAICAVMAVPAFIVFFTGYIIWLCFQKGKGLILIIMKGIITKKNINKNPHTSPATGDSYFQAIVILCAIHFQLLHYRSVFLHYRHC